MLTKALSTHPIDTKLISDSIEKLESANTTADGFMSWRGRYNKALIEVMASVIVSPSPLPISTDTVSVTDSDVSGKVGRF